MTWAFIADEEEFGGYPDPGSYPNENGVPVRPGYETETCNTCLWCDFIPDSDDPGCFVKRRPGQLKSFVEFFPVEPDKRACAEWRKYPVSTFKWRLMWRRRERVLKYDADHVKEAGLTENQRRDDAELDRQDRKLGRR